MNIHEEIDRQFPCESDLTISLMHQVVDRLQLTDVDLFELYETVIFWTGNHDSDHGWGSSDTSIVVQAFKERLNVVSQNH